MDTFFTTPDEPTVVYVDRLMRRVFIPLLLMIGVYGLLHYVLGIDLELNKTIDQVLLRHMS